MLRMIPMLVLVAYTGAGQTPDGEQMARIFSEYRQGGTPGCAAGADLPGGGKWTGAYGMADLEHGVANRPETVFEAGSVSKQFTAAAVLLLVERGSVALSDDIRKYFPELPVYQRTITVRNLLDHTSGLRDWGEIEAIAGWPRGTREYSHAHVLEILSRQRSLNYAPGEQWSYTNSGYNLAAMLVERVSGGTLQAFCRKEFFEPLGMAATQWRDDFRRVVADRAIAYDRRGGEWRQDMPFEDVYGNGGLLSTVGDLLRWNRNLNGGALHAAIFEQMRQPAVLTGGRKVGYGLGLFLEKAFGAPQIAHSGATAGYRAWLGQIPAKGISIAVLCNAAPADAGGLARRMAVAVLGAEAETPRRSPGEVKAGLYRNTRDYATIDVTGQGAAVRFDGRPAGDGWRFDGQRILTANAVYGDDVWEPVEHWTPGDLAEFAGTYSSDEAETVLTKASNSWVLGGG